MSKRREIPDFADPDGILILEDTKPVGFIKRSGMDWKAVGPDGFIGWFRSKAEAVAAL